MALGARFSGTAVPRQPIDLVICDRYGGGGPDRNGHSCDPLSRAMNLLPSELILLDLDRNGRFAFRASPLTLAGAWCGAIVTSRRDQDRGVPEGTIEGLLERLPLALVPKRIAGFTRRWRKGAHHRASAIRHCGAIALPCGLTKGTTVTDRHLSPGRHPAPTPSSTPGNYTTTADGGATRSGSGRRQTCGHSRWTDRVQPNMPFGIRQDLMHMKVLDDRDGIPA